MRLSRLTNDYQCWRGGGESRSSEARERDCPASKRLLRLCATALSVTMALWALWVLNFSTEGGFRATTDRFNITARGIGDFGVPCLILGALFVVPFSRAKWWAIAGLVALTAFSFFCFYGTRIWPITNPPQCVQSISVGQSSVRVFRWPGWSDGPVIVQQEFPLLPGLVWVRPLATQDAQRFVLKRTGDHHLTVQFFGGGSRTQTESSTITTYAY